MTQTRRQVKTSESAEAFQGHASKFTHNHSRSSSVSTMASPRCAETRPIFLGEVADDTLSNCPWANIPIVYTSEQSVVNEWCNEHILSKAPDYPRVGLKAGDQCNSHWQDWQGGLDPEFERDGHRGWWAEARRAGEPTNIIEGPQIMTEDMDPYLMIPMIQIATTEAILIYHIQRAQGSFPEDFPDRLKTVLESHDIMKGGIGVFVESRKGGYSGDAVGIKRHCGIDVANPVEMQQCNGESPIGLVDTAYHVLKMKDWKPRVKVTNEGGKRPLVINTPHGKRKLWFRDLGRKENAVRMSKWDDVLSYQQISYAARDALANALLLNTLKVTRCGLLPSVQWQGMTHEISFSWKAAASVSMRSEVPKQLVIHNTFLEWSIPSRDRGASLRRCRSESDLDYIPPVPFVHSFEI